MVRVNVPGAHEGDKNQSRYNVKGQEVNVVMIEQMLGLDSKQTSASALPAIRPSDICIVTMYGADKLKFDKLLNKRSRDLNRTESSSFNIHVLTVDGSQSAEYNVVFAHMVSGKDTIGLLMWLDVSISL